jgi:hypothetical protein
LGVGGGDWDLRDHAEEVVAIRGNVTLGEHGDEFHGFEGTIYLVGNRCGLPERFKELIVYPIDLGTKFKRMSG